MDAWLAQATDSLAALGGKLLQPVRKDYQGLLARVVAANLEATWAGQGKGKTRLVRWSSLDLCIAWESLVSDGTLPLEWISEPRRAFAASTRRDRPATAESWQLPPSVPACAAIVSDLQGVVRAEHLAAEVASRLAPWGAPDSGQPTWSFTAPASSVYMAPFDAMAGLDRVLRTLTSDAAAAEVIRSAKVVCGQSLPKDLLRLPERLGFGPLASMWLRWCYVRSTRRALPDAKQGSAGIPWQFPDPFEPIFSLLETGYLLDAVTPDALELVAPLEKLA